MAMLLIDYQGDEEIPDYLNCQLIPEFLSVDYLIKIKYLVIAGFQWN